MSAKEKQDARLRAELLVECPACGEDFDPFDEDDDNTKEYRPWEMPSRASRCADCGERTNITQYGLCETCTHRHTRGTTIWAPVFPSPTQIIIPTMFCRMGSCLDDPNTISWSWPPCIIEEVEDDE